MLKKSIYKDECQKKSLPNPLVSGWGLQSWNMILRYKHDRKHGAIFQAGFKIQILKILSYLC